MDPAKLKVVELRAELAALGLDSKGNKPALVERLREALANQGHVVGETTIADTSTEDIDDTPGDVSPPRTRRPGPASRTTRRRQSSSEPSTPATPTRSSRREPEATPVRVASPIEELEEPEPVASVEDPSDSNVPSCPLPKSPVAASVEAQPQTSPVKQHVSPAKPIVSEAKTIEQPSIESKPSEQISPTEEYKSPTKTIHQETTTPVKQSPVKPEETIPITPAEDPEEFKNKTIPDETADEPMETENETGDNKMDTDADDIKNAEDSAENSTEVASEKMTEDAVVRENQGVEENSEQKTPKKSDDKHDRDDKDSDRKNRRRRGKHSRWSNSHQNVESGGPDNDVQVTGEYINIRDDDEDKNRSRSKRSLKQPREPSPRRKSPIRTPEPEIPSDKVTISWYDSDLNLHIDVPDMNVAIPLIEGEFGYCWAGARASHGVTQGKVCYELRVESMLTPAESFPPGIRFGWSTVDSSLHLGDSSLSWGFEHSGRKVNNGEFEEYGTAIKDKDVVGVYLDLESTPCTITFTVNGETQGTAFEFEKEILNEAALFPHILSRNCCYKMNYGHDKYALLTKTKVIKRQVEIPVEESTDKKETDEPAEAVEPAVKEQPEKMEVEGDEKYDPLKCTDDDEQEPAEVPAADGDKAADEPKPETEGNGEAEPEKKDESVIEILDNTANQSVIEVPDVDDTAGAKPSTMIRIEVDIEIDGEEAQMLDGYVLIGNLEFETLVAGPRRPTKDEVCEVIMLCGLPGVGKTHWTQKYAAEHPEKRYNILGSNALVEKMKIDCKPFKSHYAGKWSGLISNLSKCMIKLIEIAQNRRRNYILDQTSVYPSAQRRKMREFINCKRTAVVIVPDEATYQERQKLREEKDGKDVPDGAVLEMKAFFVLPEVCSWLEDVIFAELNEEEAKKMLEKYNKEGRAAGYGGASGSRGRSHSGGRSSSGAQPMTKRSRFDNNSNDRNRHKGSDRGRHGSGPMRNRNDSRRDDRRGGWGEGGRHGGGGWAGGGGGGGGWSGGGRDQGYGRDQSYGSRDYGGRDNRSRDMQSGTPYRGNSDRWRGGARGGGPGRDVRGGGAGGGARIESRGRGGGMSDRGREGSDRGGSKGGWSNQHRGGGAPSVGGVPRNPPMQPGGRPNQPMRPANGSQSVVPRGGGQGGQPRGGGQGSIVRGGGQSNPGRGGSHGSQGRGGQGSEGQGGNWAHPTNNTNWSQQSGGNWQGNNWNQQQQAWNQGWTNNWGGWGGAGQWNKFQGQQGAAAQSQQGQQNQQGQQWSQWSQWPPGQQSFWAQQWTGAQGYGTAATTQAAGVNVANVALQAAAANQEKK